MNELSIWRIEWLRLVRTRRLLVLVIVFMFFGFVEPLGAKYLAQLISHTGGADQIRVTVPPPVPADGISAYVNDAMLPGLIVSVVVAAYACAVDSNPALSVFYRTRVKRFSTLIVPRVAVSAAGVVVGYLIGLLVAWYETTVLIGAPDVSAMFYSALFGSVYLVLAMAVTALAGTVVRSRLGTVGITLVFLLLCPIVGQIPALSRWMPSELVGAPEALLRHTAVDHFQRPLAMSVLLAMGLLVLASFRGERREVG